MPTRSDFVTIGEVRGILTDFSARVFPEGCPQAQLLRLCRAVQHAARYSSTDTRRGRPGRWPREFLLAAYQCLVVALHTQAPQLTPQRFLAHWLPLLSFPNDLQHALNARQLTVSESHLLARLKPASLAVSPQQARATRQRLMQQHLRKKGTQANLRAVVGELLGDNASQVAQEVSEAVKVRVAQVDELLEFNEGDASHLLWEEIKAMAFLLREVEPEQVPDETLAEVLGLLGQAQWKLRRHLRAPARSG